jgi:tRNA(adenine34) deaminase
MTLQRINLDLATLDVEAHMRAALAEAEAAGQAGELPIGAVVVIDNQIVSRGRARQQQRQSQLAHAELQALLEGGPRLFSEYARAVLFTTLEPCPMCLGAAVMADVAHIVFACPDAVVRSQDTLAHNPYVRRHILTYHGGVLAAEARALMARYDPKMLAYVETGGATAP